MPIAGVGWPRHYRSSSRRPLLMFGGLKSRGSRPARASSPWWAALASIILLAGCSGNLPDLGSSPGAPSQPASNIGEGKVKAGLILPLSASGNGAVAAQSMRNAAEMALAEFNNPDLQLLVKDDSGGAPGAQQAAQQALDEGAEIILGPLFGLTVGPVGRAARAAGPALVQAVTANGIDTKRVQLLGTGLWEDAQIFSSPLLDGAWYAGPDSTGFRNFSARYRSRYGRDPVRTASLAYDAVALVAALVKTQGKQRFSDEVLTNSSGFTGIDGLFRFRPDGTNQRGLAVLRVSPTGGQVISAPPKGFGGSAT